MTQVGYIKVITDSSIVLVNQMLRTLVIWLVKQIGYGTRSKETSRIMQLIFLFQFMNTGPFLLLVNSDLSELKLPIVSKLSKGLNTDFTQRWYSDIGLIIVNTMTFNMFFPIIEFVGFFLLRFAYRLWDSGLTLRATSTKSKSIDNYVDLYSGPAYFIHYKYSYLLNIIFVTFTFGAGIPILFPIALGSFLVLYTVERLAVAYSYKRPPMFD